MIPPNSDIYKAISNLQAANLHSFEVVVQWLKDCREDEHDIMENQIGDDFIHRVQGKASCLRDIIAHFEKAREKVK